MSKYNIPVNQYSKHDVFNESNVDKYFVSIDLKKANFQAMKFHNPYLVLGFHTYEDMMRHFTNLDYMIQSKYIRQVIFGNMNPKRQIKIQQSLTYQIVNKLLESGIESKAIKMFSPDEVVFEVSNNLSSEDITMFYRICDDLELIVEVEYYKLKQIKPFKFFVKEYDDGDYKFQCVPGIYHAQAFKMYNNLPINDYDLSFFHENQVARFLKPLTELKGGNIDEFESD
jgi:hypothetical protein